MTKRREWFPMGSRREGALVLFVISSPFLLLLLFGVTITYFDRKQKENDPWRRYFAERCVVAERDLKSHAPTLMKCDDGNVYRYTPPTIIYY